MMHKYSFTTSGTDLSVTTAWQKMTWGSGVEGPTGSAALYPQVVRVFGTSTTGIGEVTLGFRWVETKNNTVIKAMDMKGTPTAYRAALGGASGSYVWSYIDSVTLVDKLDLMGWLEPIDLAGVIDSTSVDLYVGVVSFTTVADATVYINGTRCV